MASLETFLLSQRAIAEKDPAVTGAAKAAAPATQELKLAGEDWSSSVRRPVSSAGVSVPLALKGAESSQPPPTACLPFGQFAVASCCSPGARGTAAVAVEAELPFFLATA